MLKPTVRPKIGLLPTGHKMYWSQYPGLKEMGMRMYNTFTAHLETFGDIISPGLADDFESASEAEDEPDSDSEEEFVIVSPFSSILSKFDDRGSPETGENKKIKTSGRLEELDEDYSMSLVYKPFQNEDKNEPEELPVAAAGVIKQRNGINYVDKNSISPDPDNSITLDPGLKNLVDSVIGKK